MPKILHICARPLYQTIDEDPDYAGSILIIDFENQVEAEKWFEEEPYYTAGVYQSVTIKPYYDAMDYIENHA